MKRKENGYEMQRGGGGEVAEGEGHSEWERKGWGKVRAMVKGV